MKQTCQISRWLIGFFICLSTLLSACQAGVEAPTTPSPEATARPTASPTTISLPATPTPTIPVATPTLSLPGPPPPFLYIHENKLFERTGSKNPRILADLPDAGEVLDARVVGDVVLVLRVQGLQRVRLTNGTTDLLLRFEVPAYSGALTADGTQVIYQQVPSGMGAHITVYQVGTAKVRTVLSFAQIMDVLGMDMLGVNVLGLTADGSGLYLIPVGQDGSVGRLLVAALDSGEIEEIETELPFEGVLASLAPNGRFIVAPEPQDTLNLYDLTTEIPKGHRVKLPHAPSHISIRGLVWVPDGHSVYFSILAGNCHDYDPDNPPAFYGLWCLDVESRALSQVAVAAEAESQFISISPDGQWLLLRYIREAMWTDTATIVHLPSGASQSFTLPGEAVVVGWR